jgi:hypothetical protein
MLHLTFPDIPTHHSATDVAPRRLKPKSIAAKGAVECNIFRVDPLPVPAALTLDAAPRRVASCRFRDPDVVRSLVSRRRKAALARIISPKQAGIARHAEASRLSSELNKTVRVALYAPLPGEQAQQSVASLPRRISTQAMSISLLLVCAPLGALAIMAQIVTDEDMRIASAGLVAHGLTQAALTTFSLL